MQRLAAGSTASDPVPTEGEPSAPQVKWESDGKAQAVELSGALGVPFLCHPHLHPHPQRKGTSKGTWESQMAPVRSPFPGLRARDPLASPPLSQPARFVTCWEGEKWGARGGGSFIQPCWPRSSGKKRFCGHFHDYEVAVWGFTFMHIKGNPRTDPFPVWILQTESLKPLKKRI